MRVAVPVNDKLFIYHNNPMSAPIYAIYTIKGTHSELLTMSLDGFIVNTHMEKLESLICSCNKKVQDDQEHKIWHYSIVDLLQGCDYLLADHYCKNTKRSLNIAGIKLYTIPRIIKQSELAVKNFIIGEHIAYNIQHIHYAS